ncbi:hypothetical protein V5O48_015812 [Marasmius crinis-equi]|uniref:F-box domain-containing protein n=1 Tax=Marasmius crinis-equi TaxID=585013 RepID=A0ABR3ETJ8_9AGAR
MASSFENCTFKPKHQYPPIRIEQLYSYHAPLTGPELEKHLRIMHDEEEDIKGYAAEISRLRGILVKLVEEKDDLEKKMRDRRSLTSPLRLIPPEIWARIFSLSAYVDHIATVPSNDEQEAEERNRALQAEFNTTLRLSHVCSRWRAVALNASEVWTSICINVYSSDAVGLLDLYLTRSKGREALDIVIWDYGVENSRNRVSVHHGQRLEKGARAFQKLMSAENTVRFRSLTILITSNHFRLDRTRSPLHDSPGSFFSRLEYLHIAGDLPERSYPTWLWQGIRQATKLNEVCIGSAIHLTTVMNDRTRTLHTEPERLGTLFSLILPHFHHLQSLSVRDTQLALPHPAKPRVRCSTLRDLKIVYTHSRRPATRHFLLLSLDLPNLRSLDLHFQQPGHSIASLSSPLYALRSSLQKISITVEHFSAQHNVSNILTWLPNLVELELNLTYPALDVGKTVVVTQFLQDATCNPHLGKRLKGLCLVVESHTITSELVTMCVRFLEAKRAWSEREGGSMVTYFRLVGLFPASQPLDSDNDLDCINRLEVLASRGPTQCIITNRERSQYFFPR